MLHTDLDAAPARRDLGAVSEIALTGVYEISKILASPARLEVTLANVLNLLSSFMQMRDGVIALLDDDGTPDVVVGAGWRESSPGQFKPPIPEKAVGQIIATAMPLVAHNIAVNPLFEPADVEALAEDGPTVSFIGVPIRIDTKVVGTLTIDRVWDGQSVFRLCRRTLSRDDCQSHRPDDPALSRRGARSRAAHHREPSPAEGIVRFQAVDD